MLNLSSHNGSVQRVIFLVKRRDESGNEQYWNQNCQGSLAATVATTGWVNTLACTQLIEVYPASESPFFSIDFKSAKGLCVATGAILSSP